MRFVVLMKYVQLASRNPNIENGTKSIDAGVLSRKVNEADYTALEEALKLRENFQGVEVEIVVMTLGDEESEVGLRKCIAMGADRGLRINPLNNLIDDPIAVGRELAAHLKVEIPDLVFCGVQSMDAGHQSTGSILSGILEMPSISAVSKVGWEETGQSLKIQRDFDGGFGEVLRAKLPLVLTIQPGINLPRYPSFKDTIRAKKTEIEVIVAGGLDMPKTRIIGYSPSKASQQVQMLSSNPSEIAKKILELVQQAK